MLTKLGVNPFFTGVNSGNFDRQVSTRRFQLSLTFILSREGGGVMDKDLFHLHNFLFLIMGSQLYKAFTGLHCNRLKNALSFFPPC